MHPVSQKIWPPAVEVETGPCLHAGCVCMAWGFSQQICRDIGALQLHFLHSCRSWGWEFTGSVHPIHYFGVMSNHFHEFWRYSYAFSDQKTRARYESLTFQCKAVLNWPLVHRRGLVMVFQGRWRGSLLKGCCWITCLMLSFQGEHLQVYILKWAWCHCLQVKPISHYSFPRFRVF